MFSSRFYKLISGSFFAAFFVVLRIYFIFIIHLLSAKINTIFQPKVSL